MYYTVLGRRQNILRMVLVDIRRSIQTNPSKLHLIDTSTNTIPTNSSSSSSSTQKFVSPTFQSYVQLMRWDKPVGTWLLYWPCFWSLSMASYPHFPDIRLLGLFGAGAWLMRSAGCIINDLWDRDIDKKVERTKDRPLASGQLSPHQAWSILILELTGSLIILSTMNTYTKILGVLSLLPVTIYPLMKRWTYWPQAFLGITFNWGIPMGFSAALGYLPWPIVLPLYGAGICWTLVYDTIYAHQDILFDRHIGVKSTALRFADQSKRWMILFAGLSVSLFGLAGFQAHMPWVYYASCLIGASHLTWQLYTVNLTNHLDCARIFSSNKWFGAIIGFGILASNFCT